MGKVWVSKKRFSSVRGAMKKGFSPIRGAVTRVFSDKWIKKFSSTGGASLVVSGIDKDIKQFRWEDE